MQQPAGDGHGPAGSKIVDAGPRVWANPNGEKAAGPSAKPRFPLPPALQPLKVNAFHQCFNDSLCQRASGFMNAFNCQDILREMAMLLALYSRRYFLVQGVSKGAVIHPLEKNLLAMELETSGRQHAAIV